ncbi:MAG: serine protease [Clostridia bacterium]|nr:serine protease [Clostridia bacterium]
MKSFFKYALVVIVCFACMFIYNMFQAPTVVGITKGESNGVYDTYIVSYSDGSKNTLTIKNGVDGEDAQDISIDDLYLATKTAKGYGDDYTLLDFIEEYMAFSVEEKDEAKAYLGALSTVEVYCEFPTTLNFSTYDMGYDLTIGSGIIYKPEGAGASEYYVITNYHVVYYSESLTSDCIAEKFNCFLYGSNVEIEEEELSFGGYNFTYGNDAIACEYVGGSMEYDIAVLKVLDSSKITSSNARAVMVNYDDVTVGQTVVAVGNADGLGTSVTRGIISVDNEYVTMLASDEETEITFRAMRTDASVNGGNSGGGLFNVDGELVGIVNSKIVDEEIEGMAFALPAVASIRLADNVIANATLSSKSPKKVDLGLTLAVKSSSAQYDGTTLSIKIVEDVYVSKVKANSACHSNLLVGDKLISVLIGGELFKIDREFRLDDLSWLITPNSVVVFNILRSNAEVTVPIAIGAEDFKAVA